MTFTVPPLSGAVAYDAAETLIGTLAPTGGTGPYEFIGISGGGLGVLAATEPADVVAAVAVQIKAAALAASEPPDVVAIAAGQISAAALAATEPADLLLIVAGVPGAISADWGVDGWSVARRPARAARALRPVRLHRGEASR